MARGSHGVRGDVLKDNVVVSLDAARRRRQAAQPPVIVGGSGWYHDAAIAEENKGARKPVH